MKKEQWEIDYEMRVKAIQEALRAGHTFYVNTFLGKLELLTLSGDWAHTKGRSWAICSREVYRWAEEIGVDREYHYPQEAQ